MNRLAFLSAAILLTASASLFGSSGRQGVSSSLVDYLYPQGEVPPKRE